MKLVAVIPCYNEERTIAQIVTQTLKYVDEVVVVNDCSTDNTADILSKQSAKTLHVLHNTINEGKGVSARKGCDYALNRKATHMVLLDADAQHDPEDIPRLLKKMKQTDADIVYTIRRRTKTMPLVFRIGNWGLTFGQWLLFGVWVSDTQSGYRLLTTDAYKKVRWGASRYAMEMEMIGRAAVHKLKTATVEIKTVYHDEEKGTTIADGIRNAWETFMLRIRLLRKKNR